MNDAIEILISDTPLARVVRRSRHVLAVFKTPLQALTTCARNGGWRGDLTGVINHQSCEGARDDARAALILGLGPEGYQAHVCAELGQPSSTTAVMGTAAAMQYLGVAQRRFGDFSVQVIVTAGVQGNAGCAGDPAKYDERDGRWVPTEGPAEAVAGTHAGTINTLVLIDSSLTLAALTRAVATITEAKTAALQRLAVGSRYSRNLATGTGTDQFAIVARPQVAGARTWSGHHTKLGQLLGEAVIEATLEALRWQNGLEVSYTRSLGHALGRFGVSEVVLKEALLKRFTDETQRRFVEANFMGILHEPQTAAAAYAVAAVADRVAAGTLSRGSGDEALLQQVALMAEGLSAHNLSPQQARQSLAHLIQPEEEPSLLTWVAEALAVGFKAKWPKPV